MIVDFLNWTIRSTNYNYFTIKRNKKMVVKSKAKGEGRGNVAGVGSVLSWFVPSTQHSLSHLSLSVKPKRAPPHWLFLPFVWVLAIQLSLSACLCTLFSQLQQMGEESKSSHLENFLLLII